ncbi:hypothetical protein CUJ90_19255 [Paraburkholderia terricola]|nr:hypothetical protein CUJ90_19255 [Paraburkholderia terricola]
MGDCATVLIEELHGMTHMQCRLVVKLCCRCVLFCRNFIVFVRAGRCRRYRRRSGAVCTGLVCLIDRVQGVAVGHHRLVCGVGIVFTGLEMPRRLAVISCRLLVM